ncbi:MAG: N-acetylneuraminate synthase [Anaerolineaceae bacterium]|nr:MAG: N-acetylneuraminate synthase [Anaerolineaceae bacterium]
MEANMNRVYIIAEAGVNHNGSYEIARKMIDEAAKAGADAVKFQTFKANRLVSRKAPKAKYQIDATGTCESQYMMLRRLELTENEFIDLAAYVSKVNIDFLSTPFDLESMDFLKTFNMPYWKIPSGEITNKPYLMEIAATNKPVILSTGMSTMEEIQEALDIFSEYDRNKITVLHCNTGYPTPYEDVNLRAMETIKTHFGVNVGYSDHTLGIEIPIAAVAMGATVIEKHFTLDRDMDGPDHKASLQPDELSAMVKAIRNVEKALGSAQKKPAPSELMNIRVARKSIVAKHDILKGDIFTGDNITAKRPGDGISPMRWHEVLGKTAKRDFLTDEKIEL